MGLQSQIVINPKAKVIIKIQLITEKLRLVMCMVSLIMDAGTTASLFVPKSKKVIIKHMKKFTRVNTGDVISLFLAIKPPITVIDITEGTIRPTLILMSSQKLLLAITATRSPHIRPLKMK
jgi:hypothetical protein